MVVVLRFLDAVEPAVRTRGVQRTLNTSKEHRRENNLFLHLPAMISHRRPCHQQQIVLGISQVLSCRVVRESPWKQGLAIPHALDYDDSIQLWYLNIC